MRVAYRSLCLAVLCSVISVSALEAAPIVIGSFDGARSARPVLGLDYENMRADLLDPANFGPAGIAGDPVSFAAATNLVNAAYLSTVNVFFLSEANALAAGEITDLENFVLAGNKLVLVTDTAAGSGAMSAMMGALDGGSLGGATGANGANQGAVVAAASSTVGPFGNLTGGAFSVSLHLQLNPGASTTVVGRSPGAGGTPILAEIAAGALGAGSGAVLMAGDVLFMDFFWPPGSLSDDPDNGTLLMNFLATPARDPDPVPEPTILTLLGFGAIAGLRAARRRSKQAH